MQRRTLWRFPTKDYGDTPDRRGWKNVLASLLAVAVAALGIIGERVMADPLVGRVGMVLALLVLSVGATGVSVGSADLRDVGGRVRLRRGCWSAWPAAPVCCGVRGSVPSLGRRSTWEDPH
jgi:hypothetical protein